LGNSFLLDDRGNYAQKPLPIKKFPYCMGFWAICKVKNKKKVSKKLRRNTSQEIYNKKEHT
jgi:hypothetical protein